MSDPALALPMLHDATDNLLTAVAKLDDRAVAEPSRLPGWTRGHVLAHLARNADALVNLLTWARTGIETPMYAGEEARDAAIERDAGRPPAVHLEDLRTSAAGFERTAASLTPEQWEFRVTLRHHVTESASRLPFRRLLEVELHHVDLGIGRAVTDLPPAFAEQALRFLAAVKWAGHPALAALELNTPDGRAPLRTGRADGPLTTVTGTPAALVGWLTGRTDGSGLDAGGAALPPVPPL